MQQAVAPSHLHLCASIRAARLRLRHQPWINALTLGPLRTRGQCWRAERADQKQKNQKRKRKLHFHLNFSLLDVHQATPAPVLPRVINQLATGATPQPGVAWHLPWQASAEIPSRWRQRTRRKPRHSRLALHRLLDTLRQSGRRLAHSLALPPKETILQPSSCLEASQAHSRRAHPVGIRPWRRPGPQPCDTRSPLAHNPAVHPCQSRTSRRVQIEC